MCIRDSLKGKVQPLTVLFQDIHGTHALFAVFKTKRADTVQRPLSCMAEGGMPQIMAQGNGLHQILIQPKRFGLSLIHI